MLTRSRDCTEWNNLLDTTFHHVQHTSVEGSRLVRSTKMYALDFFSILAVIVFAEINMNEAFRR